MSTSRTLRVPIEIPDHIKDSKYHIQFSVKEIDTSNGCDIFMEESFTSDQLIGDDPQRKIAILNRSKIPRMKDDSKPIALEVPCVIY